jgi:hypothetical protein
MFESFSKQYESVYRAILIIWVVVWALINGISFLYQLASYQTIVDDSNAVGLWFFNALGSFVGLFIGIVLIFIATSIANKITKEKKVSNNTLFVSLGTVYFLLPTLSSLFGNAVFAPRDFIRNLPFVVIWFLPSLVLLILHALYFMNINKYNEKFIKSEDK